MITNTTGQTGSGQKHSEIKDDLRESGERLSQSMKGTGDEVSKEAKSKAEHAKDYAADELEKLSEATDSAAQSLEDGQHEKLSSYVGDIAGYVDDIASSLRDKSADDLMHEAERVARENPALFIAGGLAVGLGIARLAKAGSQHASKDVASTGSRPQSSAKSYETSRTGSGGNAQSRSGSTSASNSGTSGTYRDRNGADGATNSSSGDQRGSQKLDSPVENRTYPAL